MLTYILVSGIVISRVLFNGLHGASAFKTGHCVVSALVLALLGVHLGLHYEFVARRVGAHKLPLWLRRAAAVTLSAAILAAGIYQMTATNSLRWVEGLGAVIGSASVLPEGGEVRTNSLEEFTEGGALTAAGAETVNAEKPRGNGGFGRGLGKGNGRGGDTGADPAALGDVLLGFLSITLAFAAVTAWLDGIPRARRRRRRLRGKAA